MEPRYELTHSELIAVFKEWSVAAKADPVNYKPFDDTDEYAIASAKEFGRILNEIRK